MNQILITNFNDENNEENLNKNINTNIVRNKNKYFFKIQFVLSIIIIIIILSISCYYIYSLNHKEKISKNLIGNYNIYKLYSNDDKAEETVVNNLFGIIEIPKINLYYPILSNLTEENLKVSPCKFYGTNLNENTNICIAGHNYNNDMFFSKINQLDFNDEIFIYDYTGVKYRYLVTENYEVKEEDLSPIYNYNINEKNLTLITCNNLNKNRFVITAIQK